MNPYRFGGAGEAMNPDPSPLHRKIDSLCNSWAEDHTHLQTLCREAGVPEQAIPGSPDHVPGIQELADMLVARLREGGA